MILPSKQIYDIWFQRKGVFGKIYISDDGYLYKGITGGALMRIIPCNIDAYEKEVKKQALEDRQSAIDDSVKLVQLEESLNNHISSSSTRQIEVDFGGLGLFENKFRIIDDRVNSNSNIMAVVAYSKPSDKDLDELEMDTLSVISSAETGIVNMFITACDGSPLHGKFKINYKIE